jgi:hypothetical protein
MNTMTEVVRGPDGNGQRQLMEFLDSYYRAFVENRAAFERGLAEEIVERPLEFARVFGSMFPKELLISVQQQQSPLQATLEALTPEEASRIAESLKLISAIGSDEALVALRAMAAKTVLSVTQTEEPAPKPVQDQ